MSDFSLSAFTKRFDRRRFLSYNSGVVEGYDEARGYVMLGVKRVMQRLLERAVDTEEMEGVMNSLCEELVEADICERATIMLYDIERSRPLLRFMEDRLTSLPADSFGVLEMEILRDSDEGYVFFNGGGGLRTRLALRLATQNKFLGILSLSSRRKRNYTSEELETLCSIASVVALTVENRLLLMDMPISLYRTHLPGMLALNRLRNRVMDEINRVDRYGGEFSLLMLHTELPDSEMLRSLKRFISENVRQVDSVSICGERIGIVMPNSGLDGATSAARRLRRLIRDEWGQMNGLILQPCVGIATYPQDSPFASGLIEAAELALGYALKDSRSHIKNYYSSVRQ